MILNFGHTFAHAIEVKIIIQKYFTWRVVLSGMVIADYQIYLKFVIIKLSKI